jgi:haloalkane dehalogenase
LLRRSPWRDLPESFHPTLKAVRSSVGEALVLDENMFIEKMLPGVTQRTLSADEMAEYRRPFLEAGDDRWPTLQWPREVPLSGRAGRCPRWDCRLLCMAENSVAAEALY